MPPLAGLEQSGLVHPLDAERIAWRQGRVVNAQKPQRSAGSAASPK